MWGTTSERLFVRSAVDSDDPATIILRPTPEQIIGLTDLRRPELWRVAVADKLEDGRYLLFFDGDEPFRGSKQPTWCYRTFETPNGFHAIGTGRTSAASKRHWYELWKETYPDSDYQLNNLSWLSPHTRAEAKFITEVARGVPLTCIHYRDKAVFENWCQR